MRTLNKVIGVSPLLFLSTIAAHSSTGNSSFDPLRYVNPLIGTSNGGHVFAGASLPFGMAKAGPDSDYDNQGGFSTDSGGIMGFSHMHDSGTGGAASMGTFPIFPHPNCTNDDITQCVYSSPNRNTGYVAGSVTAKPGYFGFMLKNGVQTEITVTNHTALYRFTFDPNVQYNSPVILVDLGDLPQSRSSGTATVNPTSGQLQVSGTFGPSFGDGNYKTYACIDFAGAGIRNTGTFFGDQVALQPGNVSQTVGSYGSAKSAGAWTQFAGAVNNELKVRVGLSLISNADACSNGQNEIPNFDFDATYEAAQQAWTNKLNVVSVNPGGASDDLQTSFWSGLYRSMLSPQDYTGQNPLWQSDEPYYDSYYCIWDSFRSIHPLLTLIDPYSQSRMVRSLVDIYRNEGYLPDCRMSLCKGFTQGGSNADIVITDAYLKGVPDIDWNTAYEAIIKDAEVEPDNWSVEGRGNLDSWHNLGYVPTHDNDTNTSGFMTGSISRTVEYAYNDFCIATMANQTGQSGDYNKYIGRAQNWKNMFNSDTASSINGVYTGFTGFLQPKYDNGSWGSQDPIFCSPLLDFNSCYLFESNYETYEGSAWLYTFFVPQDMGELIATLGGKDNFTSRLSYLHDSGLLYVGDEQAFLTVYQFHYAGHPGLSSKQAHAYIPSQFNNTNSGIPGNDDSGAMGSFESLSMMGIWPVSGQDVYLLNPPFFEEVSITNAITGKVATIRNANFDPSYTNIYIQNATRDGKPWTKNWIDHDFFLNGGILEFTLGDNESGWGTNTEDLPPSLTPYNF
ncbi:alpha-1,2-mannosidase, putative subfamily [Talaromyces proteolyticus]|uniref:Alpha-1,2-mannosidase, putative subfamily n=1 Tax=Talaromyces proteolyticus TaxID=1131652 RepID=A0AAD4PVW3_9EURO|nr:alpha-1,2-mannosidase, putative subfamily [Talaromyces proteolyticus]KAH8690760.1 alpha-1,2-mannosidase, putative subfamily [Talaromyces proteolyticus]